MHSYSLKGLDAERVRERVAGVTRGLADAGWETVARVREKEEQIHVSVRMDGGAIAGIVVMAVEHGKEAVFVNIVGDIDPAQIGRIGRRFNVPAIKGFSGALTWI